MNIFENKADNETVQEIIESNNRKIERCKSCGQHYEKINEIREICHRCTRYFNLLIAHVKKYGTKICDDYIY